MTRFLSIVLYLAVSLAACVQTALAGQDTISTQVQLEISLPKASEEQPVNIQIYACQSSPRDDGDLTSTHRVSADTKWQCLFNNDIVSDARIVSKRRGRTL